MIHTEASNLLWSPVGLANSRTMYTSTPNNQPNALHHFYSRAAFCRPAVMDRFDNECQYIATFPPTTSTPVWWVLPKLSTFPKQQSYTNFGRTRSVDSPIGDAQYLLLINHSATIVHLVAKCFVQI